MGNELRVDNPLAPKSAQFQGEAWPLMPGVGIIRRAWNFDRHHPDVG